MRQDRRGRDPRARGTHRPRSHRTRALGAVRVVAPVALVIALVVGGSSGCSGGDGKVGVRTADANTDPGAASRADRGLDRLDDPPGLDRLRAGTGAASATGPGPASPASGPVPAGGLPGQAHGHGSPASQPTGQGYVDTLTENRLPGTSGWDAVHPRGRGAVRGFADASSITAGQAVRLFVSTSAPTFQIQLLRLGWYDGVGARQVWLSDPLPGRQQDDARTDQATHLVMAPWQVSALMPTDGLVAGDYLAKLLASDGSSSFVPLVVHEARSTGALLMLNSTLTWQAYNTWGGASTYRATGGGSPQEEFEERSVVASMDRPYAQGAGAGGLLEEEFNLVYTAERLGLKLNYAADLDLHSAPEVLTGATGVALLGHSEYWSRQMRSALTAARDAGVNLAFLGANDLYRRVRLQASQTGPFRQMVNYKDGQLDPDKSENTTADWPRPPYADPEAAITGVQYRCAKARGDLVISDPTAWVFQGLGLARGQRLTNLVGSEFDRINILLPSTPRPIQVMAHSPVSCGREPEYADMVWYSTAGGAGVFAAGTLDWNQGITSPDPVVRQVVTVVTERVLKTIAQPQAGRTIPAVDNPSTFYAPNGAARKNLP